MLLDLCFEDKDAVQENPDSGRKADPNSRKTRVRTGIGQSAFPRKTSRVNDAETVPQTDTGGQVEKTKANG
ncbi:MAG: hypothetical protein HYS44_00040 [Candidatus Niyogibacteria bacterium]|nr:hypothetical protein [Candidatus Niyogibacteria bacterium]